MKPLPYFGFKDANGHKWRVVLSTPVLSPMLDKCYGYTAYKPRHVVLDVRYPWTRVVWTLKHELGHVSLDGLDNKNKPEEAAVTMLAVPLVTLLSRGPFNVQLPAKPAGLKRFRKWALSVDPIE